MNKGYGIGIDTSNYKTSMALIDADSKIIRSPGRFLDVKKGERGLRQETAFFMHTDRLPDMYEKLTEGIDPCEIRYVSVSNAPRRVEGSYMPVFMAGVNAAKLISSSLRIPMYQFSHQEGHIEAVMHEFKLPPNERFVFGHLSGGTTEFLLAEMSEDGYDAQIIGGTKDISIGQLLDRVGVRLGYDFPAGKYLDELTSENPADNASRDHSGRSTFRKLKPNLSDAYFNLSGPETQIMRAIDDGADKYEIVTALFDMISELLSDEAEYLCNKYSTSEIFLAGGVASSRYIRSRIDIKNTDFSIKFGSPELSGDNAVGTAFLGMRKFDDLHGNGC